MTDTSGWKPYTEPVHTTAMRTLGIALVGGLLFARFSIGLRHLPLAIGMVMWFSLGGHFVELFFLNWLRPRLPAARGIQLAARVAMWFAGGVLLGYGAYQTAVFAGLYVTWLLWWMTGIAFIAVELVAHIPLQLRGRPSFYNGLA